MKRVAFVSHHRVFPATSGNRQRILALTRAVRALGHEVTFFFITENAEKDGFDEKLLQEHQAEFGPDRFVLIDYPRSKLRKYAGRLLSFWKTKKFKLLFNLKGAHHSEIDGGYFGYYSEGISNHVGDTRFDVVFAEYIFTSLAFGAFNPEAVKVLDTHDSFADRHLAFMHLPDPVASYWISVAPEEEVRAFRRADVVVAIQEREAEDFRARIGSGSPDVVTVSHIATLPERVANYDSADAVFIGANTKANAVSLSWFIEQVLPHIRAEAPDFRLHVVGSICLSVQDQPGLVRHDVIDDWSEAYRLGSITINPTLLGTGINIKLLDAMAVGSPTVATRFGSRGLPQRFHKGIITTEPDDPMAFARAVLTLINDRQLRESEGRRAREAALEWNQEQMTSLARILEWKA